MLKMVGRRLSGWLAWQAHRHGCLSPTRPGAAPRSLAQNWATGWGINLLNPKIILFS